LWPITSDSFTAVKLSKIIETWGGGFPLQIAQEARFSLKSALFARN
jgi:hypothetical protein